MAQWFSDFIGWALGQSSQSYTHSVDTYVYMASLIFVIVGAVIVLAEIAGAIRQTLGKL